MDIDMPITAKIKLKQDLVDLALSLNVFIPTTGEFYGETKIAKSLFEAQQQHQVGSEINLSKVTHRIIDVDLKKYVAYIEILPGNMQNLIEGACDIKDTYAEVIGIPRVMYNPENKKAYYITTDLAVIVKNP